MAKQAPAHRDLSSDLHVLCLRYYGVLTDLPISAHFSQTHPLLKQSVQLF